jgi:DNA-binding beta-propeller fold protein YncE
MSTRRSSQAGKYDAAEAPAAREKELPPPKEPRKRQREVEDPAAKTPIAVPITTVAGQLNSGYADGPCASALFRGPMGIAVAPSGQLIVCDADNRRLRRLIPVLQPAEAALAALSDERRSLRSAGVEDGKVPVPGQFSRVETLCGSSHPGTRDGVGANAGWLDPCAIVIDPTSGTAFVVDAGSHTIRSVTESGEVHTLAGSGKPGYADGAGAAAQFCFPAGIALGPGGTLFISDSGNHRIRAMTQAGEVRTLCGSGVPGHKDGQPAAAQVSGA